MHCDIYLFMNFYIYFYVCAAYLHLRRQTAEWLQQFLKDTNIRIHLWFTDTIFKSVSSCSWLFLQTLRGLLRFLFGKFYHCPICVVHARAGPPFWTVTYSNATWTNHIRVEFNWKKSEEESDLTTELTKQLPVVSAWYVNTHFSHICLFYRLELLVCC